MAPIFPHALRFSSHRHQFALVQGTRFREMVESGWYREPTVMDRLAAEQALKDLIASAPYRVIAFLAAEGIELHFEPTRPPPGGIGPLLLNALSRRHFGILQACAVEDVAKRVPAGNDPAANAVAVLNNLRGGEIVYRSKAYRVITAAQWPRIRSTHKFEVVPAAEATLLLAGMATDAVGSGAVRNAMEDAARFLDQPGLVAGHGRTLLLRKLAARGTSSVPDPTEPATTPSRARRENAGKTNELEPTIHLANVEAPTFVPGVETTSISYSIDGPVAKAATVVMVVRSVAAGGDPVVVETLPVGGPYAASGSVDWNGKSQMPGGLITLKGSPYEITFELTSKSGKHSKSEVGRIELQVHDVKIVVDDAGPLAVRDEWKSTVSALCAELKNNGMPGDCAGRLIIDSPLFKVNSTEMNDASSFGEYKSAIKTGAPVPLLAQICLKSKAGDGKRSPAALIGTRLLWDIKLQTTGELDSSLGGRGVHPQAKTLIKHAASFEEDATQPKGASAHVKVGGFRTKSAGRASAGTQWDAGADWSLTTPGARDWAAFTACGEGSDDSADSAVYFYPGRMAGDAHRVMAVVDVDESLDVVSEVASDSAPAANRSNTISLTVWRRIPIVANWSVGATTKPISVPPLTAEYKKAGILIEPSRGIVGSDIGTQWSQEYKAIVDAYVASGREFLKNALESDPNGFPVYFRDYMDYWALENPDAGFFGTLWHRIKDFFGASDEDRYKQKCDDNWFGIMQAVASKIPIPDDGITALKFGHNGPHNQNPNPGSFTAGIAPAIPGLTGRNKAIFFQFTASEDSRTFIHEVGHTLFLAHAPGHFSPPKQPAGYQPNAHDKDQTCLMSYSPAGRSLCGMCFLKLGGWDYTVVKNDGTVGA